MLECGWQCWDVNEYTYFSSHAENRPPNITGVTVLIVEAGVPLSVNYTVEDDGIGGGVTGFVLNVSKMSSAFIHILCLS